MENKQLSQHIQDCSIKLAIDNDNFLKLTHSILKPEYFSSTITETIFDLCQKFFITFKTAPKEHFAEELVKRIRKLSPEEQKFYLDYVDRIESIHNPNMDYIMKQLSKFVKKRTFEIAAMEFVSLTELGELEKAKALMFNALNSGIKYEEKGLWYLESPVPTYLSKDYSDILMSTGIDELDKAIEGYRYGQFVVFLGSKKAKKTWALIHLGKTALISNLNVLHVTHEVKAEIVEKRYDMMFSSLTSRQDVSDVTYKMYNTLGVEIEEVVEKRDTVLNADAINHIRKKLRGNIGQLIIKKYPMGSCTMLDIESLLDYLEIYEDFHCDVLINDYVDIMDVSDGVESRHVLNKMYIHHKRIADERNILVATVSQSKQTAHRKGKMTLTDFAEDTRKAANVDLAIGLVETKEEAENNRMRLWVLANRDGEQDIGCCISNNIKVGQFCIQSWPIYTDDEEDTE